MQYPDIIQLRDVLSQYYNVSDLGNMCFDMGIDYDDLGGRTKSDRIRSLISHMSNRNRLGELAAYVQKTRPFIQLTMSDTPPKREGFTGSGRLSEPVKQEFHFHGNVSGNSIGGGNVTSTTTNQGDTFNMSGDFRGANLNVKSTLTNVNQTIGTLPLANDAEKKELQQLIAQLNESLQQVPPEKTEDADAVVQLTEALVATANSEKPNRMMMQITGDGLKKAAENLAGVVPNVVKIAGAIVAGILGLG